MFCQHCGTQIADSTQFCPHCGKAQLAGPSAAATPPPPISYAPPETVSVQTGRWIGDGWRLVQADLGMVILAGLVVFLVANAVPVVLKGPMVAGFYIYLAKRLLYGTAEFGDIFKGLNYFVPTLVASLLIAVFSVCGLLLCILPVFVVGAMFMFTYLFIVDKRMEFWPAMMASKDLVARDWLGFTLFFIVLCLLQILGAILLLVGLLVTVPVMYAAITVAYRDLVGFEPNAQF